MVTNTYFWIALVIGANLLFMIWAYRRARPESGGRQFLPLILLSTSMLIGILPRVLWPNSERIQISGSIASIVLTTVVVITMRRNLVMRGRR